MGKTLKVCFSVCVSFLFLNMATKLFSVSVVSADQTSPNNEQLITLHKEHFIYLNLQREDRQLLSGQRWWENNYNPHYLLMFVLSLFEKMKTNTVMDSQPQGRQIAGFLMLSALL